MIARKILKEISYAYPTSENAEKLGFADTGCYHIQITYIGVEGSDQCVSFMPHDAEGFIDKNDTDLLALYEETNGERVIDEDWFYDSLREFLAVK
jgi:hypothetical protein